MCVCVCVLFLCLFVFPLYSTKDLSRAYPTFNHITHAIALTCEQALCQEILLLHVVQL